jgi:hypothetical protein
MTEYLAVRQKRSNGGVVSTFLYYFMQTVVAAVSIIITAVTGTWVFGVILVLASKWRVFAVSPKYWWMNIKANIVDMIVLLSLVVLAYYAGPELRIEHVVLTALYVGWSLFLKPRTSAAATEAQALAAVFLGETVAVTGAMLLGEAGVSLEVSMSVVVLVSFVVGYGALRHILIQSEDYKFDVLTLGWGLIMAELGWVLYHRTILYYLGSVIIPQAALMMALANFLFFRVYRALVKRGGKLNVGDIAAPLLFTVAVVVVIWVWFNGQRFSY